MPRAKTSCLILWVIINIAFMLLYSLISAPCQLATVLAWVIVVTPAYIEVTHKLDEERKWLGLRHLRSEMTDSERNSFRRTLRLEMLAINSGFAATFFLLSLQLILDAPKGSDRFLVLASMIVLFFCATILNILQLVLYDFRLAVEKHADFSSIKASIKGRLALFGQFAWHLQIAAVIVGFALIHLMLCIAMNLLYGILLFSYYFHNRQVEPPNVSKVLVNDALADRVKDLEGAQAELCRRIDQAETNLRTPLIITVERDLT